METSIVSRQAVLTTISMLPTKKNITHSRQQAQEVFEKYVEKRVSNRLGAEELSMKIVKGSENPHIAVIAQNFLWQYSSSLLEKGLSVVHNFAYGTYLSEQQLEKIKSLDFQKKLPMMKGYMEALELFPDIMQRIKETTEITVDAFLDMFRAMSEPALNKYLSAKEEYIDKVTQELLTDDPIWVLPRSKEGAINSGTLKMIQMQRPMEDIRHPFLKGKHVYGAVDARDVTLGIIKDHCRVMEGIKEFIKKGDLSYFRKAAEEYLDLLKQGVESGKMQESITEWRESLDRFLNAITDPQNAYTIDFVLAGWEALIASTREAGRDYLEKYIEELSYPERVENLLDRMCFEKAKEFKNELGQQSIERYREKYLNYILTKYEIFADQTLEASCKKFITAS